MSGRALLAVPRASKRRTAAVHAAVALPAAYWKADELVALPAVCPQEHTQ